ncbi:hypothetical protein [Hydrotalea sp.]|uniref:hypothetical protein n=1 Tax=Hydrotalea sp. TaxID=2881279 RepID=UPI003D14B73C
MKQSKFLLITVCVCFMLSNAKSQTNTFSINYQNINILSTSVCNALNNSTPPKIGGFYHYPISGGVNYDGTELILNTQYSFTSSDNLGTAYAIQFPFKAGYLYQFSINAKGVDGNNSNNYPTVFTTLYDILPDPNTSNPTACNAVPQTNWGFLLSYPVLYSFQTINAFTTYNSPGTYTAPATKTPKYLFILAYGGAVHPIRFKLKV